MDFQIQWDLNNEFYRILCTNSKSLLPNPISNESDTKEMREIGWVTDYKLVIEFAKSFTLTTEIKLRAKVRCQGENRQL